MQLALSLQGIGQPFALLESNPIDRCEEAAQETSSSMRLQLLRRKRSQHTSHSLAGACTRRYSSTKEGVLVLGIVVVRVVVVLFAELVLQLELGGKQTDDPCIHGVYETLCAADSDLRRGKRGGSGRERGRGGGREGRDWESQSSDILTCLCKEVRSADASRADRERPCEARLRRRRCCGSDNAEISCDAATLNSKGRVVVRISSCRCHRREVSLGGFALLAGEQGRDVRRASHSVRLRGRGRRASEASRNPCEQPSVRLLRRLATHADKAQRGGNAHSGVREK